MSVVLVYDVEISQPGRKNLAVGFNLNNLIHTKLDGGSQNPVAGREEISQPGRKNLAVKFNLINLIHTKLAAAPKTPSPVAEEIGENLRGAWDRYQAWSATKFEHAFKID